MASSATSDTAERRLQAKDVLFALPLAHLLACGLFIWGYCRAFGLHVITLVNVDDVFTTSVREMGLIYALLLLPLSLRTRFGDWLALKLPGGKISSKTDDETSRMRSAENWLVGLLVVASAAAIGLTLFKHQLAELLESLNPKWLTLPLLTLVGVAEISFVWRTRNLSIQPYRLLALASAVLVVACLVSGVHKGLLDRYRDYGTYGERYLHCHGTDAPSGQLIRRLGGHDLVHISDGFVVTKDLCKLFLDREVTPAQSDERQAPE